LPQGELGDIVFIEIETEGEDFDAEEVFGTVEAVKTVSDLFMPVSGEVMEVNEELGENPAVVNDDSYGKGWLIKVKLRDVAEVETLMDATAYAELIG